MKVKEMIELLSKFDGDFLLITDGYEGGYDDVDKPIEYKLQKEQDKNTPWYMGKYEGAYSYFKGDTINAVYIARTKEKAK